MLFRSQVYAYYVLGLPWETKESIEKTYKFAKELNTQFATFNTATALMGSKFYEFVQKNRLGEINYESPYVYQSVKSYGLSSEEIYNYNRKFNREYYLRPRYILRMMGEINSFVKLKNYYNALLRFMKN